MSDSVIIIPTYNEKENIEAIIRAVTSLEKDFDVLVIDDGSPDGTAAIVKGLMADEFIINRRKHILDYPKSDRHNRQNKHVVVVGKVQSGDSFAEKISAFYAKKP